MSEQEQVASGDNQVSSGSSVESKQDVVAYDTHRKLLSEKKKVQEEFKSVKEQLAALQAEKQEREEQELKAKEDWKQLVDIKDQELNNIKSELQSQRERELGARKLDAVLRSVGGDIDRKYWGLVELDKIAVNPDSGQIDEMSVTKYVEEFRSTYPETIKGKNIPGVSNEAPKTSQPKSLADMSASELASAAGVLLSQKAQK